ncbi:MAG: lipopolysaccharide biosynthesis protein [Methylobacterium mesophilicum]|nr:lipopolysaccharide biosynthesis protein [Methylobacterium mesophilicum]
MRRSIHQIPLRYAALLEGRGGLVRGYLSAVSGSVGRLAFSLVYFIALANTLSVADFGLFATASAAGVVLSRLLAFGFISALYRTATRRPRLIGTFTAGFIALSVLSLPVMGAAAWGTYRLFFQADMGLGVFLAVVAAEALLWRPFEAVVIVNNGLGFFGRAAALVIAGTAFRAGAAFLFASGADASLGTWALFYGAANAATLLAGLAFSYPRQRLRFAPRLYARRLPDSLYVAGAEALFYAQSELDKLLVLALGNAQLAGIYAIVMRLVDLTAIPIRAFTMMLVQKMMRAPDLLRGVRLRAGIEAGIFAASTLALAGLAGVLWVAPNALGRNVAEAAPIVGLALLVPGLRNLVEYQAELLFARGQTATRALNLGLLGVLKGVLLAQVLAWASGAQGLVLALNAVFLVIYLGSAVLTYGAMRRGARGG